MLRAFRVSLLISVVGIALALAIGGLEVGTTVAILAALEISLSFDNAVVNARVLERMDERWRKLFLTVGIVIAVFGMRLVFPLVVVGLAGHLGPVQVVDLALNDPKRYAATLLSAHGAIAAFGGIFLLMIFLDFVFEHREITWFTAVEQRLARIGRLSSVSPLIGLLILLVAAPTLGGNGHQEQVLYAGVAGLATYLAVKALSDAFAPDSSAVARTAASGFAGFMYLQLLDASFSFDGVIGAFAISDKVFVIAAGLGIGALWVRSATIYLVNKGVLADYVYLEHGAHYAIGSLAILLIATIRYEVPEVVTGLIGLAIIGVALVSSIRAKRELEARARG
jgi:hypothetical protein